MDELFQNVADDKAFWMHDGKVIHNIYELSLALKEIKNSTFRHHVNKKKNDIYEWVKNTLNNEDLANEIGRVITKDKAELVVLRYITKKLTQK